MVADEPRPGFLGNINRDQETKLQNLWSVLLQTTEMPPGDKSSTNGCVEEHPTSSSSPTQFQPTRRYSLLSRTQSNISERTMLSGKTPSQQKLIHSLKELELQNNECKIIQKSLSAVTPSELRTGVLELLKHDHPDAMLLRFLRARKWDICKAFAMVMAAIVWRVKEMHVDDDILAKGELHAARQEKDKSNPAAQKQGKDFLAQMRMGKSYVHGTDKLGRPVVTIRVQLHKPGAQSEETLERYIVHVIESVRLTLKAPVETACVLFDMTGFTLSNMEYPPVKFILKCFEANYPESLGILLIHKAPWVFSGIWRLIRGWMDPDIAAKVQFTNSVDDLERFIDRDQILEELGGNEKWKYDYIEPREDENDTMNDTTTRDALTHEREQIGEDFLSATSDWITAYKANDKTKIQNTASQRAYQAERLRVNYWKLDQYVRARMCLDRMGVIQNGGIIDFYPVEEKVQVTEMAKASEIKHLERVNGNGVPAMVQQSFSL